MVEIFSFSSSFLDLNNPVNVQDSSFPLFSNTAMCIENLLNSNLIERFRMYSSKSEFSIDEQEKTSCSDTDSSTCSYAIIETDPNELDHIIDLLRQFFPRTKITEYSHPNSTPRIASTQQTSPVEKRIPPN